MPKADKLQQQQDKLIEELEVVLPKKFHAKLAKIIDLEYELTMLQEGHEEI